jgi:hypothetical protein
VAQKSKNNVSGKKSVRDHPNIMGVLGLSKARVSCQDGKSLRRVENSRYDFQIITFQDLKTAAVIAKFTPPYYSPSTP